MNRSQTKFPYRDLSLAISVLFVISLAVALRISFLNESERYYSIERIPERKVALVFGTSPLASDGTDNVYFAARMQGALDLYRSGKVEKLLLSGDNRTDHYNEPEKMKRALLAMGVASSSIVLDYAGRDTLDSMLRAREIFGVTDPILVTQRFHADRALAIAKWEGMNAIAYVVPENSSAFTRVKLYIREYFARIKMLFELALARGMHVSGVRVPIN